MTYLLLFVQFFKTGLFAVGGGMATLPFLYNIADTHPDWFTRDTLADMIAISESTPGPIGINMATYAGFHAGGVLGGIISTLALVLPSVIVILIIAKFLTHFSENKYVKSSFYALRPAVAGLVAAALLEVMKVALFTFEKFGQTGKISDVFAPAATAVFAIVVILTNIKPTKKLHPIIFIIGGAVLGIILKM